MNKKTHRKMLMSGAVATLAFLPGCALLDMFKGGGAETTTASKASAGDKVMTGEVLVTLKGKPAITTDSLAVEKEKFLKANPQIQAALSLMDPRAFDRNLLEGLIGQLIADEYVTSKGINQTAGYKAELRDLCESMERMLNAKYFSEKTTVTVSDAEVKSFYDSNKEKIRGVIVSAGGVAATGLEFDNPAAARAFIARVKAPQGSFKKAAEDDGLTNKIKDFKLVNNQSIGIDPVLRDKIVAIKTVPSTEMIEADGKFWVVSATSKEEPKYRPYEKIKDALKQELEKNKRIKMFEEEIAALRKEYDVTVNEDYFKVEPAPSQEAPVATGGLVDAQEHKEPVTKRLA